MVRYACVHGHFYQPPRENPWTGEVERQLFSGPDRDWNERIARECYAPNAAARVVDGQGRLLDAVDNYAQMGFDYGPTLLAWLERRRPDVLARVAAADRQSARRLDGHGNAIAQAFHHPILPLCDPADRRTEILWGLADFRRRFGRAAEGLWLPECAADDATLADCARLGMRFVILAARQAAGSVRPGRPYAWNGGGGRLALFFYDEPLSHAISFERAMSDSRVVARRLAAAAPAAGEGLALVATDGENYGHHAPFAEMGLAHLLSRALPELRVQPVSLGWYLARHPPREEARLVPGGSSWSCAHGVERWRSDCGCGAVEGRRQAWRRPLREALERLRARLASLYEEKSRGLLDDPWAARDAYVEAVLDRSRTADFLARRAPEARGTQARVRALKLLEMQRRSLMMFTSCGWFFDELSRLEPVQILRYAARALELARDFGADFEPDLVRDLAAAPSGVAALRDGAGVWRTLVKPAASGADEAAAFLGAGLLYGEAPPAEVHGRALSCGRVARRGRAGAAAAAGRAVLTDPATGERETRSLRALAGPGGRLQVRVRASARAERLFRLDDLRPDDRERLLQLALRRDEERWEAEARGRCGELLSMVERFRALGLPPSADLDAQVRAALGLALAAAAREAVRGGRAALEEFVALLARGRALRVEFSAASAEGPWQSLVSRRLDALEKNGGPAALQALAELVELGDRAGLRGWRPDAQIRFLRWLKSRRAASPAARSLAEALGISPDAFPAASRPRPFGLGTDVLRRAS